MTWENFCSLHVCFSASIHTRLLETAMICSHFFLSYSALESNAREELLIHTAPIKSADAPRSVVNYVSFRSKKFTVSQLIHRRGMKSAPCALLLIMSYFTQDSRRALKCR